MGHEEEFVKAFITSEKRARWVQFLSTPKRRKEILARLSRGEINVQEATQFLSQLKGDRP